MKTKLKTNKKWIIALALTLIAGTFAYLYSDEEEPQKKILVFTYDDKIKVDFESSEKYKKYSDLLEIRNMNDQNKIRMSKYEAIVFPYPKTLVKDRLKKYYDSGLGVYFYDLYSIINQESGSLTLTELNRIIKLNQAEMGIRILGVNKNHTSKLANLSIKDLSTDREKKFNLVGKHGKTGKVVLENIKADKKEVYNAILESLVNSDRLVSKPLSEGSLNGIISISSYDADTESRTLVSHDILRDYNTNSPDEYDFTIYSRFYTDSDAYFVDSSEFSLNTNEPASIVNSAPLNIYVAPFSYRKLTLVKDSFFERNEQIYSKQMDLKSSVDKARQTATWTIKASSILPVSVSGHRQTCLVKFKTKNSVLNLTMDAKSNFVSGFFNQYRFEGTKITPYMIVVNF